MNNGNTSLGAKAVTFHVATFGCQMNAYDSAWLRRAFAARGWREVGPDEARVHVVTTCSVRDKPEQKVYSYLGRLRKLFEKDGAGFAVVGGCVAQQIGRGFFSRFPYVRLVFGSDATDLAPAAVERLLADPGLKLCLTDFRKDYLERDPFPDKGTEALPAAGPGQGFVSIMQGCDNFCAYCIVPYTRGRQKSRASAAVLDECRGLVERGAQEVTLLGQNVNAYGLDRGGDGTSFAELLRRVAAIPGLRRLRFVTSHPKDLDADVIRAFGELEALCPQLHLPVQSGSDKVLKAMGRRYDMTRYREIVAGLRRARPDLALSTDLMVGFPGEGEEDFQRTLDLVQEVGFASVFSFMYSDRPGVRAEAMAPKVGEAVKAERLARLQGLQDALTDRALAAMVGREVDVLLEGESASREAGPEGPERYWRGRDPYNQVVNVILPDAGDGAWAGKLVAARIIEAKKHTLLGECRERS